MLEWHPKILHPVNFTRAKTHAVDGWRVPTRAELVALHDSGDFPEDMKGKTFWSSTPYAPVSSYGWIVSFCYGTTCTVNLTSTVFVRLVRSVQTQKATGETP